ncbi:RING/U-box superfamily protein [Salix suchowensis]|nr:RING/U-box superfamily protein [Salix suchowensis]
MTCITSLLGRSSIPHCSPFFKDSKTLGFRFCFFSSFLSSSFVSFRHFESIEIANTGALCCVAAGPHEAKSPATGRDSSNNHGEPHWRINSSFSPPPMRMWDCRLRSDGLSHGSRAVHGSSLSSNSRGSRSWVGSERYTNHHHSVSDGALPYSDSPPDTVQEPRWTSPVRKFNLGEPVASTAGAHWFPCSTERRFSVRASDTSPGFGSPSSLSESSHWESTSKRPLAFSNRNISTRRSHMSKTVYPLVFRNPVSDCETFGDADNSSLGRLTPHEDRISPSHWPDSSSSVEYKFHKTLTELQNSRREGFRWSSASSYDVGIDGERFDIAEHMDMESLRSPSGPVVEQKCGVCGKLLWQKSPWSSHRIMRGGDMPTAGVLPCSHVFHAECLEQVTPKTQIHDPPAPLSRRNSNGSSITSRLRRHFMFKGKSGKELFNTKVFLRIGSSSSQKPA